MNPTITMRELVEALAKNFTDLTNLRTYTGKIIAAEEMVSSYVFQEIQRDRQQRGLKTCHNRGPMNPDEKGAAKFKCWLFGCQLDSEPYAPPECWRCGADLYDADFVQLSLKQRIIPRRLSEFYWKIRHSITKKCDGCGKRLWFNPADFCCKECSDTWIPF